MPNTPPKGLSSSFHTNTEMPPESIPAMAPARFTRFQNREKRMMGPKVAPKPDQAKETTSKMMLFSSQAMAMPTTAMAMRTMREMRMICLSVASFFTTPPKRFLATAEVAMSR